MAKQAGTGLGYHIAIEKKGAEHWHLKLSGSISAANSSTFLTDLNNYLSGGPVRAVTLGYAHPGGTMWNYEVLGHIHEVSESDLGEDWTAVIDLEVTFVKAPSKESTKKIIFQKNYHHSAVCEKKEPVSVVAAMSTAVKELSLKLQKDIYRAIQDDIKTAVVSRQ